MDQTRTLDMFAPRTMLPARAQADPDLSAAEQAALCDELFGSGFLLPGGEAEILRLVKPMPHAGAARVLVVGAGVAGPARVLAMRLGMQVTGYERLPPHSLPPAAEGAVPVNVVQWMHGEPIPRRAFHHALALTPLRDGAPEPILACIAEALRPAAHLILVDYAATNAFDLSEPDVQDWMRHEQRTTPPIKPHELSRALARLGMQIRTTEDMGPAQVRLAAYDWRRLLEGMHSLPAHGRGQLLLDEASCWSARAKLLRQGQLRLIRWHAVCPAGRPSH